MPQPPPDVNPEVVAGDLTEVQLQAYLTEPFLSVDTETVGLHHHRDRLCLVQLCDGRGRAVLVQIPAGPRGDVVASGHVKAPRLKQLLEAPSVLKVLHFARFDVAAVRHNLGIDMGPIYCTRTASKLARTYTDRHGLKDCLAELLDVEMEKAVRHSDWSNPVLTPEQIRYAVSDVTLLIPLMRELDAMLERRGRKEMAARCFQVIPVMSQLDLMGFDLLFEH